MFDLYKLILIEIDMIKKGTIYRKLKKEQNKKVLKYYSYSKLGHFTRDYRSKNIVLRPQFNIIRQVINREDKTHKGSKPLPK